jgi:8-oxo-dGTP diphosphatase
MNERKVVTAAIIEQSGLYLITRRAPGEKLAGAWEFCGGKVDSGETPEQCLSRELHEELGIDAVIGVFFTETCHRYAHGEFLLKAYRVPSYTGEITLTVHDQLAWVPANELTTYDLLPADVPIAQKLQKEHHV